MSDETAPEPVDPENPPRSSPLADNHPSPEDDRDKQPPRPAAPDPSYEPPSVQGED